MDFIARGVGFSVVDTCNLCMLPIQVGEPRWKKACQHEQCGKRYDLASKACQKTTDCQAAFTSMNMKQLELPGSGDNENEDGKVAQQEVGELRRIIATKYGSTGYKAADIREMVVKSYRSRQYRKTAKVVKMDQLSFEAHMQYVRGWKEPAIKRKWAEVEAAPRKFRTTYGSKNQLLLWVPQNAEVAIDDIIGADTFDNERTIQTSDEQAERFLYGAHGGVSPDASALFNMSQGLTAKDMDVDGNPYLDDFDRISDEEAIEKDKEKWYAFRKNVMGVPSGRPSCPSTDVNHPGLRSLKSSMTLDDPGRDDIRPEDSVSQVSKVGPSTASSRRGDIRKSTSPSCSPAQSPRSGASFAHAPSKVAVTGAKTSANHNPNEGQDHDAIDATSAIREDQNPLQLEIPPMDLEGFDNQMVTKPLKLLALQNLFEKHLELIIVTFQTADAEMAYSKKLVDVVEEAKQFSHDSLNQLPVHEVIKNCIVAEEAVGNFKLAIGSWETPTSIPEKEEQVKKLVDDLRKCAAECCEYVSHINLNILSKKKKEAETKKKNWRNAKTAIQTSLTTRNMAPAVAKIVAFAQHSLSSPCEQAGVENALCTNHIIVAMGKAAEDATSPFNNPGFLKGELADLVQASITKDEAAIKVKAEDMVGYLVSNKKCHAISTIESEDKPDWSSQVLGDKMAVLNVGEKMYKKHVILVAENGKLETASHATCMNGLPQVITVAIGNAAVVVLSFNDMEKMKASGDLGETLKNLTGTPLEQTLGRTFLVKQGESVWVPYGSQALVVGLCVRTEENRFKKQVFAWPPHTATTSCRRCMQDFTVCVIDPVLDVNAVKEHQSFKSKTAAQVLVCKDVMPKSFGSCQAFTEFKTEFGI